MTSRWIWAALLFVIASLASAGHWATTFSQVGEWESAGPSNIRYYSGDYDVAGNTTSKTIATGGAIWMGFAWIPTRGAGDAQCEGEIIATLTWVPSNGNSVLDPPPPVAFVKETASAAYYGSSGDCDPGITTNQTSNTIPPDEYGFTTVQKSAVKYHVKTDPGSSFNVTCEPSASVTAAGMPGGTATVSYKVEAWAVNIAVGGTTADPNDQNIRKILPGQKVTGAVVYGDGAPLTPALVPNSDPEAHDTTWTISDCSPFLNYVVTSGGATGTLTTYAEQPGAMGWAFWGKPGTGKVACSHKMKLTEGPGTVFTVSLEKTVPVVDLQTIQVGIGHTGPGPFCVPFANGYHIGLNLMNYSGLLVTPSMFIVGENKGEWSFVQVITSTQRGCIVNDTVRGASTNFSGGVKLDDSFPYFHGGPAINSPAYHTDTPNYGVGEVITKIWMQDEFEMYWFYTPPTAVGYAVKPVPVRSRPWQVGIEARSSNDWQATGLCAGGAYYSLGSLKEWPLHPQWTEVIKWE